jgi:hypothetical protein
LFDKNQSLIPFDPDYPLTAGPLALAETAVDADALVAADLFRADLPNVISPKTAWLTWVTRNRIAPPDPQSNRDRLLLADPAKKDEAIKAGWPAPRIHIAAWPQIVPQSTGSVSPPVLALFTDTRPIEIPKTVEEFSSQLLLWEFIEDELTRDPQALGDDPDRYLDSRMSRFNIRDENFDRALFHDRLIAPAYKRGLATLLVKNGIRVALFGRGWSEIPELKSNAMGEISNLHDLTLAVSQSRAILQPFPRQNVPPAALPLHIVQTDGVHPSRLIGRIRQALSDITAPPGPASSILNADLIASLARGN